MRGGAGRHHAWLRPSPHHVPFGDEHEVQLVHDSVLHRRRRRGLGQALAQTETTTQTTKTETKYATVDGEVVRYDPGHVIVVRGMDNKEITYTLAPSITVPAEVKVGRRVTLFTEPGTDGTTPSSRA